MPTAPEPADTRRTSRGRRWLRRLGAAGFLFFLVKGLLWLLIPAALFTWQALIH